MEQKYWEQKEEALDLGILEPAAHASVGSTPTLTFQLERQHTMKLLYPVLTLLLAAVTLANPAVKPKVGRVAVPFGAAAAITEGKNAPIGGVEETANYVSS